LENLLSEGLGCENPQSSQTGGGYCDRPLTAAPAASFNPDSVKSRHALSNQNRSKHGCIRAIVLPHHSHMSESYAINTADTQLTDQILEFIAKGK
jgi:hypothetical protein